VRLKVIETAELGHHEPSGKIRLGLRVSFLGDTGVKARGHCGPIGWSAQACRRSRLSLDNISVDISCPAWRLFGREDLPLLPKLVLDRN